MTDCRYVPRTQQQSATWLVVVGLLVLAGAIAISFEFEAQVRRVNWAIVTGVCGGAFMVYVFWRIASNPDNGFDPLDLMRDPVTQRASLWRVLIVVAFAIGIWTMGQWVITGSVPPGADKIIYLYSTILLSLVAKVASGEWADTKANRQPVPAGCDPALPAPQAPQPGQGQ